MALLLISIFNAPAVATSICTKHATDGSLGDWGLTALKNNASWGMNSTWVPNAGIQFIVKDNYNTKAALYSNYPSGVHIYGTGSSYSFYDDPQVMYKGGYPVWEPYGGELYNLEAFYFDQDSNCIYVTVITSESPTAQGDAAPADFAMNLDNNSSTGKWGYEYGVKLESYHTRNNPLTQFGLYYLPDWQQPPYIPLNRPSYFDNGTYISQVKGVYKELKDDNGNGVYDVGDSSGKAYPNYIIQLAIPKDEVGNPTNVGFDSFHFSDYCGNDHIAGFGINQTQELDHFEFGIIHSPQTAGVPFSVTITAKDSANNTVLSYNGHVTLSDSTGTISPTITGNFVDGVWSGNLTITKAYNATHISAHDGAVSGLSNNFDVVSGPVVSITVHCTPSIIQLHSNSTCSVTASDAYGNLWDATADSTFSTNDPQGKITGNIYIGETAGNWSVNATYDGVAGSAIVTVETPELPTLASIVISPNGSTNLLVGDNLTFTVYCYDTANNSMECPELTWNSSNSSVASVSSGTADTLSSGTAGITAQSGAIVSNTVDITVSQSEGGTQALIITCTPSTINAGETSTCTAQLNNSGIITNVTDEVSFSIQSSAGGSWSGNVYTSQNIGSWTVTASYGELEGTTGITVNGVGCQYHNPDCLADQQCVNNACVYIAPAHLPSYSGPSGGGGGSASRGCAYNDPRCQSGYTCVNNKCVPVQQPQLPANNTNTNATTQQTGAGPRLDIQAPATELKGDMITVKLVLAGTNTPVPKTQFEIITPTHEKLILTTDDAGEATYLADEVGVYRYIIPNPATYRVTNILERMPNNPRPQVPSNATVTKPVVPSTIAQVLSANAPLCAGLLVLLAILLFALSKRRKKEEKNTQPNQQQ